MNGCPSIFDNGLVLPLADGLPCLDEQLPPSFDKRPPPPLNKWSLPLVDGLRPLSTNGLMPPLKNCLPLPSTNSLLPQQMLFSRASGRLAMSNTTVIARVVGYSPPSYYT